MWDGVEAGVTPVPLRVTVCICTYRRATLLGCLTSVFSQILPAGVVVDAVVVDNCPDGSAAATVERAVRRHGWPIDYHIETGRNLSRVRNTALAASEGDLVAMIDDDEHASPLWLASLIGCLERYQCDGVIGPVFSRYSPGCPDWIEKADLIARPAPETGRELRFGHAGNALLRRATLRCPAARFDERFGQTGGEDTDLFLRLTRSGVRLVGCREAVVHELIAPERENMAYLVRENRRVGQVFCRVVWPLLGPTERFGAAIQVLGKAALFGVVAVLTLPFGKRYSAWWCLHCLCNVEKIRYGFVRRGTVRSYCR